MPIKFLLLFLKRSKLRSFILFLVLSILLFFLSITFRSYKNIESFIKDTLNIEYNDLKFSVLAWEWKWVLISSDNRLENIYKKLINDKNLINLKAYYHIWVPSLVNVNLFWKKIVTDLLLYASDNLKWNNFSISNRALNLYNLEVANNYYPIIRKDTLSKLSIEVCIWKSVIWESSDNPNCFDWNINTFDLDSPLFWITISKDSLWKFSDKLNIVKIVWEVKKKDYLERLWKDLIWNNFTFLSNENSKIKLNKKMKLIFYIFIWVSSFIIIICLIFIYYIVYVHYFSERDIYKVLFLDWINNKISIIFAINYFIFLLFLWAIFVFVLLLIFDIYLYNYLNNFLINNWINFEFIQFNWIFYIYIILWLFFYMILLCIILFRKD